MPHLPRPAAWSNADSPADLLEPMLRAAAELARRIALTEPDIVDASDEPKLKAQRVKRAMHRVKSRKKTATKSKL